MSFLVGLHHVTSYRCAIKSYSLEVLPANHFANWQQDPHGNWISSRWTHLPAAPRTYSLARATASP